MAISVNSSRNLLLYLINKSNNGYITPEQSDSFMDLAQMKIFENLSSLYNQFLNKQNKRLTGGEYADIPKNIREMIDVFSEYSTTSNFVYNALTDLWSFNGTDLYRAENLSLVTIANNKKVDIEEVGKSDLNVMRNSPMTTPSLLFPVYVRIGSNFRVAPTIPSGYTAELFYLRTPRKPKWTYNVIGGNPIFNQSASDFQDVELHPSLFEEFMVTVLSYAGINLRETEVTQYAESQDFKEWQKQQQP
jgi:hypothetical protein